MQECERFSMISCWEHGSKKSLLGAEVGKEDKPKAAIECLQSCIATNLCNEVQDAADLLWGKGILEWEREV